MKTPICKMTKVATLSALCLTGTYLFAEETPKTADQPATAPVAAAPVAATKTGEAAGIGAWTTDYPAALKVAKERKMPLFLQFTGSDWCGWCQWMETACLSKTEFLEGMKDQCVLVVVDFPQKTQLPDALKKQNTELSARFKKVGNFPVYKIVDYDDTILWWFGADPKYCNKAGGVKRLVNDITEFCSSTECSIERAVKELTPEKAAAYRAAAKEYRAVQIEKIAWYDMEKKDTEKAKLQLNGITDRMKAAKDKMAAAAKP